MAPPNIASLPNASGVYKFFNRANELIYVGKSKDIKKRVSSYFGKQAQPSRKLQKLVSEIRSIKYIITDTEYDALLLENNLIKQHQPRYNILLKDGKTYPYLCITKERFPRALSTRKYNPKDGEYFGPYTNVVALNHMLELLHQLYPIRTCSFLLSERNIAKKKFKVCLAYHIGNCMGPCAGLQDEESYMSDIDAVRNILKRDFNKAAQHIASRMKRASALLQFEQAERYKHKLALLRHFREQSTIVNPKNTKLDVITITSIPERAFVNYMQIKEGVIAFSEDREILKKMDESDERILGYVFQEMRAAHGSSHRQALSNKTFVTAKDIKNSVPQRGDKKRLVSLSLKNALYQRKLWQDKKNQQATKKERPLVQLQKDLSLKKLPQIIECFDISNLQGSLTVASMVQFVKGMPKKSNYRRYNIKTVVGSDDFASMKEVVSRRYRRLIQESQQLPDLIIIDGGKGQLKSACDALKELSLYGDIPIISIAKRLEEIYYPNDSVPLHLNKQSPSLLLLQRIRNEAHRFAIAFHRLKRRKRATATRIGAIPGIGTQTLNKLLAQFKSWEKIRKADPVQLEKVIGKKRANLITKELAEEDK